MIVLTQGKILCYTLSDVFFTVYSFSQSMVSIRVNLFVRIQYSNAEGNTARMYSQLGRQKISSYLKLPIET